MSPRSVLYTGFAAAAMWVCPNATAGTIFSTGAGSAISGVPNGTATFDLFGNGTPLTDIEGGLKIDVLGGTDFVGFDPTNGNGGFSGGFFYANGKQQPIIIQRNGGGTMDALEVAVGDGFGSQVFLAWISSDGSGVATVSPGSVAGFRNSAGVSFLALGAYGDLATAQSELTLGLKGPDGNGLAIDNVSEQNHQLPSGVPEPGTGLLALMGAASVALMARGKQAFRSVASLMHSGSKTTAEHV